MSNKILRIILVLVTLIPFSLWELKAEAASTDTVAVKVTITASISVNITETELLLGSVATGSTTVSATGVTVTNNGSGVNETYSLSLTNPDGWTASQTAAGAETYVLNSAFDGDGSSITWLETNHALSTTPVACSATKFAGDQTGINVPYNSARKLWFQFKAPTFTTVNTQQSITVTVTAAAS